jgi:hypothetical protein
MTLILFTAVTPCTLSYELSLQAHEVYEALAISEVDSAPSYAVLHDECSAKLKYGQEENSYGTSAQGLGRDC